MMPDVRSRSLHAGQDDAVEHEGPPILVVDDDPIIRQFIRQALEYEGWRVLVAEDGKQATEQAALSPIALVVLDITLPLIDGFGVAEALRARHGEALPILVISADVQVAEKARRIGAYHYLRKPFDLTALLQSVHRGLRDQNYA